MEETTPIQFFFEGTRKIDMRFTAVKQWIEKVIIDEGYTCGSVQFIFSTDDYLLSLNKKFLGHDDYTDIITFDYSEKEKEITGDIFISLPRVEENATAYGVPFHDELHRVMVHGVLHLAGYDDRSPGQKKAMERKENYYLSLLA